MKRITTAGLLLLLFGATQLVMSQRGYGGGAYNSPNNSRRSNVYRFPGETKPASAKPSPQQPHPSVKAQLDQLNKEAEAKGGKGDPAAPSIDPELSMTAVERLIYRFDQSRRFAFDEKLYLHTDKEFYSAADTIFFKAYLREPLEFKAGRSAFIYVELINDVCEVVTRLKFKGEQGSFVGQIPLDVKAPSGNYQIRAYTWWMQKYDEDFFFKKNLKVGNDLGLSISSFTQYRKNAKGDLEAVVTFFDRYKKPLSGERIRVTKLLDGVKKTKHESFKTNTQGEIAFTIPADMQAVDSAFYLVNIESSIYNYSKKYMLPSVRKTIDVQFFPESGQLVPQEPQVVAFKAINKEGLSVSVAGKVYDGAGEEVAEITTLHDGMGKFLLLPAQGERYTAVLQTASGQEFRKELPQPTAAVALKCSFRKGKIICLINNQTGMADDSLSLVVHSRGSLLYCRPLSQINNRLLQFSTQSFPEGIVNFLVVSSTGEPLAERLVFVREKQHLKMDFTTDAPAYGTRSRVNAAFSVADSAGVGLGGEFSVSVTNSRLVPTESFANNIRSYFLLTSDLKGYIENPAQYFDRSDPLCDEKMDVLLLSQGWRRYNVAAILQRKEQKPKNYLEMGQSIAGEIKNMFGKPKTGANVFLFAPKQNLFRTTTSNQKGEFLFEGLSFADSTRFVLKTSSPKALANTLSLELEKQEFPEAGKLPQVRDWMDENVAREYLFSVKEQVYTSADGMRVINLQELQVVADKKDPHSISESVMAFASSAYNTEALKRYEHLTLDQFVLTLPKIGLLLQNFDNRSPIQDTEEMDIDSGPVIFIVNDQPTDFDFLKGTPMFGVNSLAVVTDVSSTSMYSSSGKPVVIIRMKAGVSLAKGELHTSIALTVPLGYTQAAQFYMPRYDLNAEALKNQPDLRTTIYWNPTLTLDPTTGKTDFWFFTADKKDPLRVVLEGFTSGGIPCRYESKIELTQ